LANFDKAANLSEEAEKGDLELLRGITALHLEGGSALARQHFKQFILFTQSTLEYLSAHLDDLRVEGEKNRSAASRIIVARPKAGGGLIGLADSAEYLKM